MDRNRRYCGAWDSPNSAKFWTHLHARILQQLLLYLEAPPQTGISDIAIMGCPATMAAHFSLSYSSGNLKSGSL